MAVLDPICSTDNVWRDEDMNRCLSDDLDTIETNITSLQSGKANKTHSHTNYAATATTIQTINTSVTVTASNGSFSVTPDVAFIDGGTYLLNLQYSTSSGLVDRSTYAFRFDTSKLIQSTTILANCYNGNDNLMASYRNDTLTFATSYNGTNTPTNLTIKVI